MESVWAYFLGLGMPVLAAAATAFFAYWRRQREELRRHKHRLYSQLQLSVFNIWAAKGIAVRDVEALCNISDAWIFASDKVLNQVNEFMKTYDDSRRKRERVSKRNERLQPIVAELFWLMRKDLFSSTDVTLEQAKQSVKFYRWVGTPSEATPK